MTRKQLLSREEHLREAERHLEEIDNPVRNPWKQIQMSIVHILLARELPPTFSQGVEKRKEPSNK